MTAGLLLSEADVVENSESAGFVEDGETNEERDVLSEFETLLGIVDNDGAMEKPKPAVELLKPEVPEPVKNAEFDDVGPPLGALPELTVVADRRGSVLVNSDESATEVNNTGLVDRLVGLVIEESADPVKIVFGLEIVTIELEPVATAKEPLSDDVEDLAGISLETKDIVEEAVLELDRTDDAAGVPFRLEDFEDVPGSVPDGPNPAFDKVLELMPPADMSDPVLIMAETSACILLGLRFVADVSGSELDGGKDTVDAPSELIADGGTPDSAVKNEEVSVRGPFELDVKADTLGVVLKDGEPVDRPLEVEIDKKLLCPILEDERETVEGPSELDADKETPGVVFKDIEDPIAPALEVDIKKGLVVPPLEDGEESVSGLPEIDNEVPGNAFEDAKDAEGTVELSLELAIGDEPSGILPKTELEIVTGDGILGDIVEDVAVTLVELMIVDESPLIIIDGVDIMDDPNGRLGLVESKPVGVVSVSRLDDDADMYGVLEDRVDSGADRVRARRPCGEAEPVSADPDKLAPERFGTVLKAETLELDPADSDSDELATEAKPESSDSEIVKLKDPDIAPANELLELMLMNTESKEAITEAVTVGSDVDKLALEAVDIALVIEMLERELAKEDCEMSVLAEDDEDSSKGKPDLPLSDKLTHAKSVQPNGKVVGKLDEDKGGGTGPLVMQDVVSKSIDDSIAALEELELPLPGFVEILAMVVLDVLDEYEAEDKIDVYDVLEIAEALLEITYVKIDVDVDDEVYVFESAGNMLVVGEMASLLELKVPTVVKGLEVEEELVVTGVIDVMSTDSPIRTYDV
ncbi:MAG: hypothetical protein Q9164_002340 [Protoblastenia rupestris]